MDKNKSIDGLTPHRSTKKATPVLNATTKTTTKAKKPATKSTAPKPATTTRPARVSKPKTTKAPHTATIKSRQPQPVAPVVPVVPLAPIDPTSAPAPSMAKPAKTAKPAESTKPTESAPSKSAAEINADFLTPVQVFDFDSQNGTLKASDQPSNQASDQLANHPTDQSSDIIEDNTEVSADNNADAPESTGLPTKKPKKVKKPVSKKRKIITTILLVIVLLLIAGITWLVIWGNDIIAKITGGQGNILDLITFIEPTYEPLKTDENGRTNILAFGTSGYNMEGDEGNGTHDGAQLTDSIMIISLDQETGDVAMLSLPRDLKASPTCTATGKINEVYWCNNMNGDNEQAGAEALVEEVSDILGVDFQYYAHLNWGSLVQIVDILGGITVTLDEGIYDYYYTEAVFEPNVPYELDGAQALGLARARHGTTSGDFSRGASQQKILIGIKDKITEKSLSITDLMSLASTLGDNLRTNFNLEELKTLAHLASDLDLNSVRQVSLIDPQPLMTTGNINGISYVLPAGGAGYYTKIQNYVAKMFSSDPRDYEEPTILVLNSTETPGLASTEKSTLETDGYTDIDIDDTPAGDYSDQYTLYALTDEKPGTKKLLEEKYSQTAKPAEELPAGINSNYDFIIIIGGTSTDAEQSE